MKSVFTFFFAASTAFASAIPLKEFRVRGLFDDRGQIFVNGMKVMETQKFEPYDCKLYLRPGDIITCSVWDKQGGKGGALILVASYNGKEVFSGSDFKYAIQVDNDWKIIPSMIGFESPLIQETIRAGQFPEAVNLKKAWARKWNQQDPVVHFKYVIP